MAQTKERREKYTNLTVEITKAFSEEIATFAKRSGVSRSELVRMAIRRYISSN